jgi:hypothetical protein
MAQSYAVSYGAAVRRLGVASAFAVLVFSVVPAHAALDASGRFGPLSPPGDEPASRPRAPGNAGELRIVPVRRGAPADVAGLHFAVAVEGGLPISPQRFARTVASVLDHPRGWRARGYAFARAGGAADVEIVLASPATTDRLCAPLATLGRYSCAQEGRVVLNFRRWRTGTSAYASLRRYRMYMINHELGHLLGRGHAYCPAAGADAPVMAQQTKGVAPCRANPWPLPWE